MAKTNAKKIINGMTIPQLEEFRKNITSCYLYEYSAAGRFSSDKDSDGLTKKTFLDQYYKWDDQDKEQIETLLKVLKLNIRYSKEPYFSKDAKGKFAIFTVENADAFHTFKIYGSVEVCCLFTVNQMDGAYDRPAFTLQELYEEALK